MAADARGEIAHVIFSGWSACSYEMGSLVGVVSRVYQAGKVGEAEASCCRIQLKACTWCSKGGSHVHAGVWQHTEVQELDDPGAGISLHRSHKCKAGKGKNASIIGGICLPIFRKCHPARAAYYWVNSHIACDRQRGERGDCLSIHVSRAFRAPGIQGFQGLRCPGSQGGTAPAMLPR